MRHAWSDNPTIRIAALAASLSLSAASHAQVNRESPEPIRGEGVTERRGESVPLDTPLYDESGNAVRLGDYFDGRRPVIFTLVYYDCPMLCNMMLGDLNEVVRGLKLELGDDYRVVALSFDHTNTVAQAVDKKMSFTSNIPGADEHWSFLLGAEQSVRAVADSVGFEFNYIEATGEFAHPSVFFVLSPSGVISNYMYGRPDAQFSEKQVRLALADAAEGKVGSLFDRVVFWCYHWDPDAGVYSLQAFRVMQIGAALTALSVAGLVGGLFWTGRRRHHAGAPRDPSHKAPIPG